MKATISHCDDCGWTSRPTTAARADYAYRKHSCAKQRADRESHQRGLARDAAIDRTSKPCLHKKADHQHGTYACYVLDGCRCLPCSAASSEYDQQLHRRNAYGRSNLVDAQSARDHVRTLTTAGVGLKRIVIVAGVPQGVLWKLVYGKRRPDGTRTPSVRITMATQQKILALRVGDPDLHADGAKIDPAGTQRRLQALVTLGWSVGQLSIQTGLDRQRLDGAIHGRQVLAHTARAVAETYGRLWATRPDENDQRSKIAAARARNYSAAYQWAPPLAWDDDTIDDPTAKPQHRAVDVPGGGIDEAAVERRMAGEQVELTRAERWVLVTRLHAEGLNDQEIARRTGIPSDTVMRDRQSLSLPPNADRAGNVRDRIKSVA